MTEAEQIEAKLAQVAMQIALRDRMAFTIHAEKANLHDQMTTLMTRRDELSAVKAQETPNGEG